MAFAPTVDDNSDQIWTTLSVQQTENDLPRDSALVGSSLLFALGLQPSATLRIGLSLSPRPKDSLCAVSTQAWDCWARWSEELDGLAIPLHWTTCSPTFRGHSPDRLYSVELVKPPPLLSVFLAPLTAQAYDFASSYSSTLEKWFLESARILQQGGTYAIPSSVVDDTYGSALSGIPSYRVVMAEPSSGQVVDTTQLYFARSDISGQPTLLANEEGMESSGSDSSEEVTIDEGFLASTVLSQSTPVATRVASPLPKLNGMNEDSDSRYNSKAASNSELTILAGQLMRKVASDDHTLCLKTAEAGKLGILSGDWAVINGQDSLNYRLVRVLVQDEAVPPTLALAGSPVLLRNITTHFQAADLKVELRPSPFGNRAPTIPTAKSITVARVPSPLSTNRKYESTCLSGLRDYFSHARRLIRSGDMLAIAVNLDDVEDGYEPLSDGKDSTEVLYSHGRRRTYENANALAFFSITHVEHDILPHTEDGRLPDMYTGATIGELGCWMDSSTTRLLQVGVEHQRVPDIVSYYDLGHPHCILPVLRGIPQSRLIAQDSVYGQLCSLISTAFATHSADYGFPLSFLLSGSPGVGKSTLGLWVAQSLGIHLLDVDCYNIVSDTDVKTEGTLRAQFEKAAACSPCIILLRHLHALQSSSQANEPGKEPYMAGVLSECIAESARTWKETGYPLIVIGTVTEPSEVDTNLTSPFKHDFKVEAPNEAERLEILQALLHRCTTHADVSLRLLAVQTAALVARDLVDLASKAIRASASKPMHNRAANSQPSCITTGISHALSMADFSVALDAARLSYSESIGAPKIPNVSWDDVGGLTNVKSEILDTIQLPLEHPELFANGMKKRSGILLYGPPGTGKTLLAKAVATSCSLNFFSVKGPELLNMYIGESEANVRRVFQRARDASPCVVFFDELDSVAPKRGNQGDSGGVMDRIVSQLLAELDGMSSGKSAHEVFVIGATNRPDLLDSALLRPGRFDRMLYLGVTDNHDAQLRILEALTRKFRLHPDTNLAKIADSCPFNYTGADFYALCSDAMLKAMSRTAENIDRIITVMNAQPPGGNHPYPMTPQYYLAELASAEEIEVLVSQTDFEAAAQDLVPSVSQAEMDHYSQVQKRYAQNSS